MLMMLMTKLQIIVEVFNTLMARRLLPSDDVLRFVDAALTNISMSIIL